MEVDLERRRIRGSWDLSDGELEMRSQWPTVDGALGVTELDDCVKKARNFFYGGFFLLPWLWFLNCFYFWPILRHRSRCPEVRPFLPTVLDITNTPDDSQVILMEEEDCCEEAATEEVGGWKERSY